MAQHHREFHPFPKLPLELRHMVWKLELESEESRIVEIRWSKVNMCFFTDLKTPAPLHACSESRKAALEVYSSLAMVTTTSEPNLMAKALAMAGLSVPIELSAPIIAGFNTYINWDKDIIYLNSHHLEHSDMGNPQPAKLIEFLTSLNSQPNVAQNIRSIALTAGTFDAQMFGPGMFNMANLERINFVFDDTCCMVERMSLGKSKAHTKAIEMKEMVFPEPIVPLIPLLPTPPIIAPVFGSPILLRAGLTFPSRRASGDNFEGDTHIERCKSAWKALEGELFNWLDERVAGMVGKKKFDKARLDWSKLEAVPVYVFRGELVI